MAEKMKKHIKDPGSAITHFIGMLMAIFAAVPLLLKAAREPEQIYIISITVYAISLILLYAASTSYHTFICSKKITTILKKIDHMMIFILIAGSYTPICLLVLKGAVGKGLCALVWGIALVGIIIKMFFVSEVVFFRIVYWNGMDMCPGFWTDTKCINTGSICLAVGRWCCIYRWRCYLCFKTSNF